MKYEVFNSFLRVFFLLLLLLVDVFARGDAGGLLEVAEEGGSRAEAAALGQGGEGVETLLLALHQLLELGDAEVVDVVVVVALQVLVEEVREGMGRDVQATSQVGYLQIGIQVDSFLIH